MKSCIYITQIPYLWVDMKSHPQHRLKIPGYIFSAFKPIPQSSNDGLQWVKVAQSCPTLCNPMDCTVREFSRPEYWSESPFSRGSSQPRDRTQVSGIVAGFFTNWATTLYLNNYLCIWLCLVFIAACRFFSCGMGDLVPWPGIEPWPPALGASSLSHWTAREVPKSTL